jgi:Ca-activated chloride channel family protein
MAFLWPEMLLALILVPIGVLAGRAIDRRRRRRWSTFVRSDGGAARAGRSARHSLAARAVPILSVAAIGVLIVALARPQGAIPIHRSEGTLMLTFDVSGSMSATDVGATRLEAAKAAARSLVAERPEGVVIGVVAFSDGGMSVQVPTSDEATVNEAIDRLAPALGTSLGEGVLVAIDTIDRLERGTPLSYYSEREPVVTPPPPPVLPGSHAEAAIVLLTDGENTVPPDPATTALSAADRGIRVHTIGIGSAAGTALDLDGFLVQTQLDAAILRFIADATDGTAHVIDAMPSAAPGAEPAGVVDANAIYESLGTRPSVDVEPIELTSIVAGSGLVLLVAATLLSLFVSGRAP